MPLLDLLTEVRKQSRPGGAPPPSDDLDTEAIEQSVDKRLASEQASQQKASLSGIKAAGKQMAQQLREQGYTVRHDENGNPVPLTAANGERVRRKFGTDVYEGEQTGEIYQPDLKTGGLAPAAGKVRINEQGRIIRDFGKGLSRDEGPDPAATKRIGNTRIIDQAHERLLRQHGEILAEPNPAPEANKALASALKAKLALEKKGAHESADPNDIAAYKAASEAAEAAKVAADEASAKAADRRNRISQNVNARNLVPIHKRLAKEDNLPDDVALKYADLVKPPEVEPEAAPVATAPAIPAAATVPAAPAVIPAVQGTNPASTGQQAHQNAKARAAQTQDATALPVAPALAAAPPTPPTAQPVTPAPTPALSASAGIQPLVTPPPARLATPEAVADLPIEQHAALMKESAAALDAKALALQQRQADATVALQAIDQQQAAWKARSDALLSVPGAEVDSIQTIDGQTITFAKGMKDELRKIYDARNAALEKVQPALSGIEGEWAALKEDQEAHNQAGEVLRGKMDAQRQRSDEKHTLAMEELRANDETAPYADKLDALRNETRAGVEEISRKYPDEAARKGALDKFQEQQEAKGKEAQKGLPEAMAVVRAKPLLAGQELLKVFKETHPEGGELPSAKDIVNRGGDSLAEIRDRLANQDLEDFATSERWANEPGTPEEKRAKNVADFDKRIADITAKAGIAPDKADELLRETANRPYTVTEKGEPSFAIDSPLAGFDAAVKDGIVGEKAAKELRPKFEDAQKVYDDLVRVTGDPTAAKAAMVAAGGSAAFIAGASAAGAGAGTLTAELPPIASIPITVVSSLVGGVVAEHAYQKGLDYLAGNPESFKLLEQLHPTASKAGGIATFLLAPEALASPRAIWREGAEALIPGGAAFKSAANLVEIGKIAGQGGATFDAAGAEIFNKAAAAKQVAKVMGLQAAGGAAFTELQYGFDAARYAVADTFGIKHDELQHPGIEAFATNIGLAVALGSHNTQFKDYSQRELQSITMRYKAREDAGIRLDAHVTEAEIQRAFSGQGVDLSKASPADQADLFRPLTPQEVQVRNALKAKTEELAKSGALNGKGIELTGARQAQVGSMFGRGSPITTAGVEPKARPPQAIGGPASAPPPPGPAGLPPSQPALPRPSPVGPDVKRAASDAELHAAILHPDLGLVTAVRDLALGTKIYNLTASQLGDLGLQQIQSSDKFKPLDRKDAQGNPVPAAVHVDANGNAIILQPTIDRIKAEFPATAELVGMSEAEARSHFNTPDADVPQAAAAQPAPAQPTQSASVTPIPPKSSTPPPATVAPPPPGIALTGGPGDSLRKWGANNPKVAGFVKLVAPAIDEHQGIFTDVRVGDTASDSGLDFDPDTGALVMDPVKFNSEIRKRPTAAAVAEHVAKVLLEEKTHRISTMLDNGPDGKARPTTDKQFAEDLAAAWAAVPDSQKKASRASYFGDAKQDFPSDWHAKHEWWRQFQNAIEDGKLTEEVVKDSSLAGKLIKLIRSYARALKRWAKNAPKTIQDRVARILEKMKAAEAKLQGREVREPIKKIPLSPRVEQGQWIKDGEGFMGPVVGHEKDGTPIMRMEDGEQQAAKAPWSEIANPTVDKPAHGAATSPTNDLPQPTGPQKDAGNFQKGHITFGGLGVSIENPAGSERTNLNVERLKEIAVQAKDETKTRLMAAVRLADDGKFGEAIEAIKAAYRSERGTLASTIHSDLIQGVWSVEMKDHYGYVKRSEGADGDGVDIFIKEGTPLDYKGPVFVVSQNNPKTGEFDEHKVMAGYSSMKEAVAAYHANYSEGWKGFREATAMSWDGFKAALAKGEFKKSRPPKQAITTKLEDWIAANPQAVLQERTAIVVALSKIPAIVNAARNSPQNLGAEVKSQASKVLVDRLNERLPDKIKYPDYPKIFDYFTLQIGKAEWIRGVADELRQSLGSAQPQKAETDDEKIARLVAKYEKYTTPQLEALRKKNRGSAAAKRTFADDLMMNQPGRAQQLEAEADLLDAENADISVAIYARNKVETPAPKAPAVAPPWDKTSKSANIAFAKFKRALSKAINAKDWPAVLEQVKAFKAYYERPGSEPYPDDWARWDRAEEDAKRALGRAPDLAPDPTKPLVPTEPESPASTLPEGWTTDDVQFLLDKINGGKKVYIGNEPGVGIPAFQSLPNLDHKGYGVFDAHGPGWKGTVEGGGAMQRTPSGKGYTILSEREGSAPYDFDGIKAALAKHLTPQANGPAAEPSDQPPTASTPAGQPASEVAQGEGGNAPEASDKRKATRDKLKELLKKKQKPLSAPSGGPDLEMLMAMAEHAASIIEEGKTTPEAFAKAMVEDFEDLATPETVASVWSLRPGADGTGPASWKEILDALPKPQHEPPPALTLDTPQGRAATAILKKIDAGTAFDWRELFEMTDAAWGGTQAEGKYTVKDAYDAMELAVNKWVEAKGFNPADASVAQAQAAIQSIAEMLTKIPTQSKRTEEADQMQQFSTPPHFGYVANWVANIARGESGLEPSAGIGGLAVFGKNAGAVIIVNELSARRRAFLEQMGFDVVLGENAENLNAILDPQFKSGDLRRPTVVVMNPPFSNAAKSGVAGRSIIGANHVMQALRILEPGGRLVAIVGEGMALDAPTFRDWWRITGKTYNVRVNVWVDGSNYAKYGTTFSNRLLVIDKPLEKTNNATDWSNVVGGQVSKIEDLLPLLKGIRDDRLHPATPAKSDGGATTPQGGNRPPGSGSNAGAGTGVGVGGTGGGGGGGVSRPAPQPPGSVGPAPGANPPATQGGVPRPQNRPSGSVSRPAPGGGLGNPPRTPTGPSGLGPGSGGAGPTGVTLTTGESALTPDVENPDDIFANYTPSKVRIEGAKPHPANLVESAAMASVEPPDPTYVPNIPAEAIARGMPSLIQLEAVVYAGQAHQQFLRSGERKGYFIGDGTGVGKGIEIGTVMLDNIRQDRPKHVWLSKTPALIDSAMRDVKDVGLDPKILFKPPKAGAPITNESGIVFVGYKTLSMGHAPIVGPIEDWVNNVFTDEPAAADPNAPVKWQKGDKVFVPPPTGAPGTAGKTLAQLKADPKFHAEIIKRKKEKHHRYSFTLKASDGSVRTTEPLGPTTTDEGWQLVERTKPTEGDTSRLKQLVRWLGRDFDGVIAFDESHLGGNAIAMRGSRGVKDPSLIGVAMVDLQRALPKARVLYVSATGATEVSNLSYADRLGLWGVGTAFANKMEFFNKIQSVGISALEIVARDAKALGVYMARSISYKGVKFERLTHALTPEQQGLYNTLGDSWRTVLENIWKALNSTGQVNNGRRRGNAASAFWGAQQRFYIQILTAMQMPTLIRAMHESLDAGHSILLQLVNTNEAQETRALARAATEAGEGEDADLDDLDLSPRDTLMDLINRSFPTQAYEEIQDPNNPDRTIWVPMVDAEGLPVEDPEAIRLRDEMLVHIQSLDIPESPLNQILDEFGWENVAEITGRNMRFVTDTKDGKKERIRQSRSMANREVEAEEYQDGKKKILMFSAAGGTGFTFSADLRAKNQDQRDHYIIQPGWRSDVCIQGTGRSHRSNQKQAPFYKLVETDIPGHKRFMSTIARRLAQMGALTTGERRAASQGLFKETDNLESIYADHAITRLVHQIFNRTIEGWNIDTFARKFGFGYLMVDQQTGDEEFINNLVDQTTGGLNEDKIPEVTQFLNRLLCQSIADQAQIFGAFDENMQRAIDFAKRTDTYDEGTQNYRAHQINVQNDEVVYEHPGTTAKTRIVDTEVVNLVNFTQFDEISQLGSSKVQHFVRNIRSGRIYALKEGPDHTNAQTGAIEKQWRRVGTHTFDTERVDAVKMRGDDRNYEPLTETQAREAWDAEINTADKYHRKDVSFIVGAFLPIWDRVEMRTLRVYRFTVSDGRTMLGVEIPPRDLPGVRRRLGAQARNIDPAGALRGIVENKDRYELANGWSIHRALVSGQQRVEVNGPGGAGLPTAELAEFRALGGFVERIGYTPRFFIPNDDPAPLAALFAKSPPVSLNGEDLDAGPGSTPPLSAPASGKRIGYDNMARITNPTFGSKEKDALRVNQGGPKSPMAAVEGKWNPSREIPADIDDWTPAGFNPRNEEGEPGHSYLYDKRTGDPIIGGSEALAVGNSVFVKNPVFGERKNFLFAPESEGDDSVDFLPSDEDMREWKRLRDAEKAGTPIYSDGTTIPEMPPGSVGMRNAYTDWKRKLEGLPPRMRPVARGFGQLWDEALAQIDAYPTIGANLAEEITERPRPLTDVEDAILTHELLTRQQEQEDATNAYNNAPDAEERLRAWQRLSAARDKYIQVLEASARGGTENARGLNARRMAIKQDFTLARLEARLVIAHRGENGKAKITEEQLAEIYAEAKRMHDRIEETERALAASEDEKAKMFTYAQVEQMIADVQANIPQIDEPRSVSKIIDDIFARKKALALATLGGRPLSAASSATPEIPHYEALVDVGAANYHTGKHEFEPWLEAMHADGVGGMIVGYEREIFAASRARHREIIKENKEDRAKRKPGDVLNDLRAGTKDSSDFDLSGIRALAIAHIRAGVRDREELVARVQADLADVYPGITEREVSDALSRYGQTSHPSDDPDLQILAEIKKQLRLTSAIEDALSGKPPLRTGFQPGEPSDIVRGLTRQLREAIKAAGIQITDPATQLKSAQDAIRTRLRNRKEDLQRQVDAKKREPKTQRKTEYDDEMKGLAQDIADLEKALELLDPKPGRTIEQKIAAAEKALELANGELRRKLAAGDISKRTITPLESDRLKDLRDQRDELRERLQTMRDAVNPKLTPEQRALKQLKRRTAISTGNLKRKLAKKDFSKKVRKSVERDAHAENLIARNIEAKRDFLRAENAAMLSRRPLPLKAVTWLAKWARVVKISGITVTGKLLAAANIRTITHPIEDVVGAGLSLVPGISGIARRAPRHFGLSLGLGRGVNSFMAATARSFVEGWMNTIRNAPARWRTGLAPWEAAREKKDANADFFANDRSLMDYVGHSHMLLKSPAVEAEYARSLRYYAEWAMANGIDITQPVAQIMLSNAATRAAYDSALESAYEDSQRAKLMQPNPLPDAFNAALRNWETSKHWSARGGKYGAQIARILFPIIKIPSNYATEAMRYSPVGGIWAIIEAAHAIGAGVEKLPPDRANDIMRHLIKGSIGLALLLLGWWSGGDDDDEKWLKSGGWYQEHEKRRPDEVGAGRFRLFGWNVPKWLSHTPALEAIQFGATMRRVMDHLTKKTGEHGDVGDALLAGASGLVEEIPFVTGMEHALELGRTGEVGTRARGNFAVNLVWPRGIQEATAMADRRKTPEHPIIGEPVKREPKTILEHFKAGIPGLRGSVPEKGGPLDEWGNRKDTPHEPDNAERAFAAHNKANPRDLWKVPQVGAETLNKLPVMQRDPFKARVAELRRKLAATGINDSRIVGKGADMHESTSTRVDPVTDFEARNPSERTYKKVAALHRAAYTRAKREFKIHDQE